MYDEASRGRAPTDATILLAIALRSYPVNTDIVASEKEAITIIIHFYRLFSRYNIVTRT